MADELTPRFGIPADLEEVLCFASDDYRIEIKRFEAFIEINGMSIFEGRDSMCEGLVVPLEALSPLIAALEAQRAITPGGASH